MTHTIDTLMALAMDAAEAELAWDISSSKHPDDEAIHGVSEKKAALRAALTEALQAAQPAREPYDKTEMNAFVQSLYDQKMQEGKHGHYETLFHVVHAAIARAQPAQEPKP